MPREVPYGGNMPSPPIPGAEVLRAVSRRDRPAATVAALPLRAPPASGRPRAGRVRRAPSGLTGRRATERVVPGRRFSAVSTSVPLASRAPSGRSPSAAQAAGEFGGDCRYEQRRPGAVDGVVLVVLLLVLLGRRRGPRQPSARPTTNASRTPRGCTAGGQAAGHLHGRLAECVEHQAVALAQHLHRGDGVVDGERTARGGGDPAAVVHGVAEVETGRCTRSQGVPPPPASGATPAGAGSC